MSVQIDGSTGNIIATKADYSGDVSIGGTLTYEDVTNVDSVGIITARSGVNVTGGSVGIGTDSPVSGVKLHLQDTSACRLQLSTNNTGHTSSDGVRLMIDGSNNFEILQREEANIEFFTNNTERARITSSGNFGIGETSPTRKLVVAGDTNTVAVVRGATNGTSNLFLGDTDDEDIGALTYNHPSNYLSVTVNASERLRIDSSGRLLVGTTSIADVGFAHGLQVESLSSNRGISIIQNSNDQFASHIDFAKTRGTSTGSNTAVQSGDDLGSIIFRGADGTDKASNAAFINCEVDGTPGSDDMPGRLIFATTADGASSSTERIRIDSSGQVILNNSVSNGDFNGSLTFGL